jgi:CIC family chloride channel protein
VPGAEPTQCPGAGLGEPQSDDPLVIRIPDPAHETGINGAVDQSDGAVVAHQQRVGDVTNGGTARVGVAPHREEQLVLRGRESFDAGLLLAPPEKTPQRGAHREELAVLRVGEVAGRFGHRVGLPPVAPLRAVQSIMGQRMRRVALLTLIAAIVGAVGGGAAWLLLHLIGLVTNLALLHEFGWKAPSFAHHAPGLAVFPAALAGAGLVTVLALWAPMIRGHGIPEAMEAVLEKESRISLRAAIAKPLSAALAIGTGGPFGAEGPIIVTGGAIGSLLGQVLGLSASERKILLACGAAAGMSATFGAPLASIVLAVELLLFEFSIRALIPLLASSSVAAGMHAALIGRGPVFTPPHHAVTGLATLPTFAVLGLVCGLLATVVCSGLFRIEAGFRRLPISEAWHPLIGAVGFATIGLIVPRALGVGYDVINDVLANRLATATLAALLVAKLGAWWIALASGTSGGTLAPLLLVSGSFGALLGHAAGDVVPGWHGGAGTVALVAMAATFGAATRAPLTAVVFAFELTRDYDAVLALMIATVVAFVVAAGLLEHGLMTEKLARRGLRVPSGYEPNLLRSTLVERAMHHGVVTIASAATVDDARRIAEVTGHGAYPIVDDNGHCVGIVGRDDLLASAGDGTFPIESIASREVVTIGPRDNLLHALERFVEEDVSHLPVVDGEQRLVGMCTRTDLLRVEARRLSAERRGGHRPARDDTASTSDGGGS